MIVNISDRILQIHGKEYSMYDIHNYFMTIGKSSIEDTQAVMVEYLMTLTGIDFEIATSLVKNEFPPKFYTK